MRPRTYNASVAFGSFFIFLFFIFFILSDGRKPVFARWFGSNKAFVLPVWTPVEILCARLDSTIDGREREMESKKRAD